MTWQFEFGNEYDIPREVVSSGLADQSWHNDACPSFGLDGELLDPTSKDVHDLRLWIEHPDRDERESGSDGRFIVNYQHWSNVPISGLADANDGEDIYNGDDVNAALAAFRSAEQTIRAEIEKRK